MNPSHLLLLLGLAACADEAAGPGTIPVLPLSAALVSAAPSLLSGSAALQGPGTAYVSMLPGTEPAGFGVVIQNGAHGAVVNAPMSGGGFDPVRIAAVEGDTLLIRIQHTTGRDSMSYSRVPRKSRPVVVRTAPPRRRTDVPLNSIIQVVFSEPMDSASLTSAITLSSAGLSVPGSVVIPANNGDILRANFVPGATLAPLTTYQLHVGTVALNRTGDSLSAPINSDFTTGSLPPDTTAPVVTIFSPASGDTVLPDWFTFHASVTEAGDLTDIRVVELGDSLGNYTRNLFSGNWASLGTLSAQFNMYGWFLGTYTFQMTATDAAGNTGYSAPFTLTVAAPDTQPRIVIRSFSLIEFEAAPGVFGYAPQLLVADAPGQSGLDIGGFELLTIGSTGSWPNTWAHSLTVPAGQDTELFEPNYYGWAMVYAGKDPYANGGLVRARLTYRDRAGHNYATIVQGPIVAGSFPSFPPPTSYPCNGWSGFYLYPDCTPALRQGARAPALNSGTLVISQPRAPRAAISAGVMP